MASLSSWLGDWMASSVIKNLAQKAVFQYQVHSGTANVMADNPHEYIEKGYSGNTSVYSIVSRIDAMRKQAVLTLKDKDGNTVEDHPLLKFLSKVNPTLFTDEFITQILTDRLIIGEFFVYKLALTAGMNKGKCQEIHPLPSADVEIIEGDWMDPIRGYKISGNYQVEMSKNEVFHSKMYNPSAFTEKSLHGQSPLKAARMTVSKLNQIEVTETKAFENQGPPYILFKKTNDIQQRLTDPQQADYIKKIKNASKPENRGLPFVAKDELGRLDLGQKLADLAITESENAAIIKLSGVYHFPAELGGYGQKTYNNMAEARKAAWTDCIIPNLEPIQTCFNSCLIEGVEEYVNQGLHFEWDYSDVEELQEGIKTKVEWMVKARWTGNEIREATGKTKIDDPNMDQPIIPMGEGLLSDLSVSLDEGAKNFDDYLK